MAKKQNKRKDTYWLNGNHRVLRDGEYQRISGKYEFRYKGEDSKYHSLYSWRLTESDKSPIGKDSPLCLREMEAEISRDRRNRIDTTERKSHTLNSMFDLYISGKTGLKQSTRTNYIYLWNKYVRHYEFSYEVGNIKHTVIIGEMPIEDVEFDVLKAFYNYLLGNNLFKINSLESIQTLIHPTLRLAVRKHCITFNPADSLMREIKQEHGNNATKRHALTEAQTALFIDFCRNHPIYSHWLNLFTVFLGTGCRVAEITGLRWEDCDFEDDTISINHNLIYRLQDDGHCKFHITTPKTDAGNRIIPMMDDVRNALLKERMYCMEHGFCLGEVDGYSDFIFQNRDHDVISPHCINRAIERIRKECNVAEKVNAKAEHRKAVEIPHFTCHHLRHTFCTRLCENETDLKVIQEIMGHANIETTMDVYNEATAERKQKTMSKLNGKIKIS